MHHTLQQNAVQANTYWLCPKTGIEMAVIPSGSFYYGSSGGMLMESHTFSMARHPVTNTQWLQFIRDSQYAPDSSFPQPDDYLRHWLGADEPPKSLWNHPVVWVSLIDALHFVRWAGLSIPSEWCWEKAARGTEGRAYPWGNDSWLGSFEPLVHVNRKQTASVDDYPDTRTAFGCEQMIGNVSEFCLSVEGLDDEKMQSDFGLCLPTPVPSEIPPDQLIAVRGSCYRRKDSSRMVCSHQRRLSAGRRNSWTGLRVAWCEFEI